MIEISPKDSINIKTWPAETCLVNQLVKYLCKQSREDLAKHTVILPTTRLTTFVRASLAKHFGALIPPKLCTLEQFVREQSGRIKKTWKIYNSTHIELTLTDLIKKNSFTHLRAGHERELALFFEELVKNKIGIEGFDRLEETIKNDIYRSQEQLGSLYDRCLEIKNLWNQFHQLISSRGFYTPEKALENQSQIIIQNWEESGIKQQPILLVAFTSISPSLLPLVSKLAESNSQLWFHEPPKLLTKTNPLEDLLNTFEPNQIRISLQNEKIPASINSASTAYLEVLDVISEIKKLLAAGVSASKIAVLVTNETTYGKYLRMLCPRLPSTNNIALSMPVSQTPIGGWIQTFTQIFATNEATHAVLSWLCHPITLDWIQNSLPNQNCLLTTESCVQRLSRQYIQKDLAKIGKGAETPEERELWELVLPILKPYRRGNPQTLSKWLASWRTFIDSFKPSLEKNNSDSISKAALTTIEQFLDDISDFSAQLDIKMSSLSFCQWLTNQLLKQEVRSTGEPLAGVQVISLPEARSFPFHSVFILGCNEGNFPKSLPKDDLLDDFLKRRMGLPGWQALEAREDLTFQLLLARIPNLHLYYSETKLEEPLVRSRFVEQVLAYSSLKVNKKDRELDNPSSLPPENLPPEGLFPHPPSDLGTDYSATSLETLIHCPYRFLLSKLQVKEFSIPGLEADPRDEGEWLHKVLEKLFDYWPNDLDETNFEVFAVERLLRLSIEHGPDDLETSSLFMHLKDFSWPRFASHLKKILAVVGFESAKSSLREHRFSFEKTIAQQTFTLRGSIDYVLPLSGKQAMQLITDYKRKGLPSRKDISTGTSPQLAVYSQALPSKVTNNIIAGYWSILDATWQIAAIGSEAKALGKELDLATTRSDSLEDYLARVDELWEWRLNEINDGKRFKADPTDCHFCTYENICRRDDPRHKDRIHEQNDLAQRIEGTRE